MPGVHCNLFTVTKDVTRKVEYLNICKLDLIVFSIIRFCFVHLLFLNVHNITLIPKAHLLFCG